MLRRLQGLLLSSAWFVAMPAHAQDPFDDSTPADADPGSDVAPTPEDDDSREEPAPPPRVEPDPVPVDEPIEERAVSTSVSGKANSSKATGTKTKDEEEGEGDEKQSSFLGEWELGLSGYFRAPMALGISNRPGPDNLTGPPELQVSYGPNRTVDANYFSFAYTRLQEQDWVELFVHAKKKHVQATIGWMGYWYATAGFRNSDAAWIPGVAYLTLDTDFEIAGIKPNIALSGGSWWPKYGRFEKYDTFTLAQYRQLGEQLKLTIPFSDAFTTTLVQGFGTGRDGSFNISVTPPIYAAQVGLNLIHYAHLQFNFSDWFELGLHQNAQWTRDPNLLQQTSGEKSYTNARQAHLMTFGGEVRATVPHAGTVWVSPSYVLIKNGWALGEAGVEVVHGLSPEGLGANYLAWTGSPTNSTGSGSLFNLGFLYENSIASLLGEARGSVPDVTLNVFGLLVDARMELPVGSTIPQDQITHFKWGADIEYHPWKWLGLMVRWDQVNADLSNPGYIFSAITPRLSFFSDFLSGERIYLQYSRYQYGDNMVLAGNRPWGVPIVPGSDIIQGGPYAGSIPDMDVIKFQADIHF